MVFQLLLVSVMVLFVGECNIELCLIFSGFIAGVFISDLLYKMIVIDTMFQVAQLRAYKIWYRKVQVYLCEYVLKYFLNLKDTYFVTFSVQKFYCALRFR